MLSRWIATLITLLTVNSLAYAQTTCVQPSRLIVAESGIVTPGSGNNVRSQATTSASLVGVLNGSEQFAVISEAVCDDSFVWVEVQTDEFTGWTVEADDENYWLQPVTGEIYANDAISLMIPPELTTDVTFEILPELDSMGGLLPVRQSLIFEQEEEQKLGLPPYRLIVAPIADYSEEAFSPGIDAVDDLRILLEAESEFDELILENVIPGQPTRDLTFPSDPFIFASRRLLIVSPHYVDMENGHGIAFITMYGQDIFPANNDYVFYNFVGMTDDEHYMVTMQYPVRSDMLPDPGDELNLPDNWRDIYSTYIHQATESLNTLLPDEWTPSLDALDTIVNSIYVTGGFENEE